MEDYDAKLGIYSNNQVLTDKLKNKFEDKYLDVVIFDNYKKVDLSKFSYLVIDLMEDPYGVNALTQIVTGLECKIIILLSMFVKPLDKDLIDSKIKDLIKINGNIGVMLVPELLGEGVKYNESFISHNLIMQSLLSERIKISSFSTLINTVTLNKLADRIVVETFSFGISGQVLALVGPRHGQKSFTTDYLGVEKENIIVINKDPELVELNRSISSKINFSLNLAVKSTKSSFAQTVEQKESTVTESLVLPEVNKKVIAPKNKKNNKFFKNLIQFVSLAVFVFITPLLFILTSVALLFFASKTSIKNTDLSEVFISYSLKSVSFSQNISFGVPFYYNYSNILYKTSFIVQEAIELSKIGNEFASKVMGKSDYDLNFYSDDISSTLDRIHTDIGFLQSDINELNDFVGIRLKDYLLKSDIDISKYKDKVYQIKGFSSRISTLLGMKKPMKYLILFQNNMELRPTGGFIGSFATISFEKGKLTEIVVSDVYSADGQLKGHVDPPEPIKTHLGEGGWYLRDSNWDPDFPTSASKVEWFLDKEVNTKVDGVIAIDLSFVQKLLKITGPLELSDFNMTISSDNLYSNTQNEVESNFFPGSIKKASFMTSLSKKLINEVENLPKQKYFALIKEIYTSLEERHVQLYFHDFNAQENIKNLGYAGEVNMDTNCDLRCINDRYSLIDANVGVNKSNLYIKRDQELHLDVGRKFVRHELFTTYQNTADQSVGNAGIYKNYARLLIPLNATVTGIRLYNTNGSFDNLNYDESVVGGKKEIGFLVSVLPHDSKKIQIVWNIDTDLMSNGGEYNLLVRKQAGTDNDGLKIQLNKTDLTLTGRVPSVYTTTLARDFSLKLFLKP